MGVGGIGPSGGGSGAPTDAQYVTMALNATLTAERVLTAGSGLSLADGGANGNATLSLGAGSLQVVNVQRPGTNITGAGFHTVASFTLTGGLLGTNNMLLCQAIIQETVGTGGAGLRLSYGGSIIATSAAFGTANNQAVALWNEGATNAQRGVAPWGGNFNLQGYGTLAIDSTANQTVLVELDLATDTDNFICRRFFAWILRAP